MNKKNLSEADIKAKFITPDGKLALIPIAPVNEQKAIIEKVEVLMQKCNELESQIIQNEQHVNMLMQAVLKEAFETNS